MCKATEACGVSPTGWRESHVLWALLGDTPPETGVGGDQSPRQLLVELSVIGPQGA